MNDQNAHLPKILWLWIPIIAISVQLIGEHFLYRDHVDWIVGENGPYELLQFFIILAAFFVAAHILWRMDKSNIWLTGWIGIATLSCFYVAGEEISWTQHILEFGTPEYWAFINDQGETNLHNTTSWLDQKPRLALIIGVYTGGLIIPLLLRYEPSILPEKFSVIYPTREFAVMAGIALLIKIIDKLSEYFDIVILSRSAENEELFLFYFVLLYLFLMKKRLIPAK